MLDSCGGEYSTCAGLDLAVSKNFAALVVLGKDRIGRYRVLFCQVWKPRVGGRIDQEPIEEKLVAVQAAYRLRETAADPFAAEYLISRASKRGVRINSRPQSGKNLVEQCMSLIEQATSRNIDLPAHPELEYDLRH